MALPSPEPPPIPKGPEVPKLRQNQEVNVLAGLVLEHKLREVKAQFVGKSEKEIEEARSQDDGLRGVHNLILVSELQPGKSLGFKPNELSMNYTDPDTHQIIQWSIVGIQGNDESTYIYNLKGNGKTISVTESPSFVVQAQRDSEKANIVKAFSGNEQKVVQIFFDGEQALNSATGVNETIAQVAEKYAALSSGAMNKVGKRFLVEPTISPDLPAPIANIIKKLNSTNSLVRAQLEKFTGERNIIDVGDVEGFINAVGLTPDNLTEQAKLKLEAHNTIQTVLVDESGQPRNVGDSVTLPDGQSVTIENEEQLKALQQAAGVLGTEAIILDQGSKLPLKDLLTNYSQGVRDGRVDPEKGKELIDVLTNGDLSDEELKTKIADALIKSDATLSEEDKQKKMEMLKKYSMGLGGVAGLLAMLGFILIQNAAQGEMGQRRQ